MIRTRLCMSADGYVTRPDGWPAQLADPDWDPERFGFRAFQESCDAVLMGRTTFEPALGAPEWPWADLDVFVLGSHRPERTPDTVVVEDDPARLLEHLRGREVHLVGGPKTVEAFRRLGALDELRLIVLPLLLGSGLQLTPSVSTDAKLTFRAAEPLPTGAVELVYGCD